jgi:hypothetical protein
MSYRPHALPVSVKGVIVRNGTVQLLVPLLTARTKPVVDHR